jgi:hypothetical protein
MYCAIKQIMFFYRTPSVHKSYSCVLCNVDVEEKVTIYFLNALSALGVGGC